MRASALQLLLPLVLGVLWPRGVGSESDDGFPEQVSARQNAAWFRGPDLAVQFWTWNSGIDDVGAEAVRLFESDADVLVTCQTEGRDPIGRHAESDSRWLLVSYAEHWGMTGDGRNAQMLSVFIRHSLLERQLEFRTTPKKKWPRPGQGWGSAGWSKDVLMDESVVPGVVRVRTKLHQMSDSGKGGISTDLRWAQSAYNKATRTMFLCAHLDSESDLKRRKGLLKMMTEMRSLDYHAWKDVVDRRPGALWDGTEEAVGLGEDQPVDVAVILGDLNYRIRTRFLESLPADVAATHRGADATETVAALTSTRSGRFALAAGDPLNPGSVEPSILVQGAAGTGETGLGFSCNEPYEDHFPTYKIVDWNSCSQLDGRHAQDPKMTAKLVRGCYMKYEKEGQRWDFRYKNEGKEIQFGWLDRVCFRTTHGSGAEVKFWTQDSWPDVSGSDHMAMSATLVVAHPRLCPSPPYVGEHSQLLQVNFERFDSVRVGQKVMLLCDEGFRISERGTAAGSSAIAGRRLRGSPRGSPRAQKPQHPSSEDFVCTPSGDFLPVDAGQANISDIQCVACCGVFRVTRNMGPIHVSEAEGGARGYLMAGQRLAFSCADGYHLVGSPGATCGADGKYQLPGDAPRCAEGPP